MSRATWPLWIRRAFDDHFAAIAKLAAEHAEVEIFRQKLDSITLKLKRDIPAEQFQLILDWEAEVNYISTVEKEFLYLRGVQDGMLIIKELYGFMSSDV